MPGVKRPINISDAELEDAFLALMFPGSTQEDRQAALSIGRGNLHFAFDVLVGYGHNPNFPTERNTRRRLNEAASGPVAGLSLTSEKMSSGPLSLTQQTASMDDIQQSNSPRHGRGQSGLDAFGLGGQLNRNVDAAASGRSSASSPFQPLAVSRPLAPVDSSTPSTVLPLDQKSLKDDRVTHYEAYLKGLKNRKILNVSNLPRGRTPSVIMQELATSSLACLSPGASIVVYWPLKANMGYCHLMAVRHDEQLKILSRLNGSSLIVTDEPLKVRPMNKDNKPLDMGQINFSASRSLSITARPTAPNSPTAPGAADTNLTSTKETNVNTESSSRCNTPRLEPSEAIKQEEEDAH
ncbi:hypothetical protein F5Y18DRAFT_424308 [Xylariaceae sp. FL1019]|nr:hypothetical protein F5Y18DRAFT_424308 [Xylariaceae sp. FL1019]